MRSFFTGIFFMTYLIAFSQQCDSVSTEYERTYQNHGAMFNVVAYSPIIVDHITANLAWNTAPFELYYKVGGFQGFENQQSAWTLLGSATITSNNTQFADTTPTVIPISINQTMTAGDTIALYLTSSPVSKVLLKGTTIPWGTYHYTNADMGVSIARSMYQLFGVPFSTPQIWNGSVAYCGATVGVNEDAITEPFSVQSIGAGMLQILVAADISADRSSLSVQVLDMTGRMLLGQRINAGRTVLPIRGLTSGTYVVSILDHDRRIGSRKLMVE